MRNAYRLAFVACLAFAATMVARAFGDDQNGMFPFNIVQGAPDNITNVQTWNGAAKAAGSDGFLQARSGEFATNAGSFRALGTNICFGANFPSREKAERLADSLSRFGIGVVRLHHMDSRDIWGKNLATSTTEIDPEQLDKLDYLIAQFHKRGIYVNINLHVSRAFKERDGFENADKLPTQNKGVDNFEPRMIALQKKYAKDLLTHVNPYIGKSYADDPGVAVVEINNENSLVASWSWGELDELPEPYAGEFKKLWNEWLAKKYGTSEKLRDAWECKTYPLGDEVVADDEFGDNFGRAGSPWHIERDEKTDAEFASGAATVDGDTVATLNVKVNRMGSVAWRPQFNRVNLAVVKGRPYQISFKYRSANDSPFTVGLIENHDPWGVVAFRTKLAATKEWQTFTTAFLATKDDPQVRLTFNGFQEGTQFELAEVSYREGGLVGLDESQRFEDGTVPALTHAAAGRPLGARAQQDFAEFLHDLERAYWDDMYRFVKSLGVKSPVTGTQLQYGYWYNQGRLDYCDIHAYWNHPTFPNRPWDGEDWYLGSNALANSPTNGTLASLASLRVLGKPFTCSEYDHPYPNYYCAEGNVMLAAVAAFQDWSATFQFAWSHSDAFERETVGNFFDMCSNQVKMAHLPACYAMFVRGDVKRGPGELVYAPKMSEEDELRITGGALDGYHRSIASGLKIDKSLSLAVYSGIELTDLPDAELGKAATARRVASWKDLPESCGSPEKKEIVNEFGEIRWNFQQTEKGFFTVDTANTKVFSGFVTAPVEFDGVKLDVKETILGWATVSLVKGVGAESNAEKVGKLTPGRYLLTATGHMANTGAVIKEVADKKITTGSKQGGSSGHAPVLCEGIPAELTLRGLDANSIEAYALDASGARGKRLDVANTPEGACLSIGPEYRALWYEIVVK